MLLYTAIVRYNPVEEGLRWVVNLDVTLRKCCYLQQLRVTAPLRTGLRWAANLDVTDEMYTTCDFDQKLGSRGNPSLGQIKGKRSIALAKDLALRPVTLGSRHPRK